MNDHWLTNVGPLLTFLFVLAALMRRRMRQGGRSRPARAARNSIVTARTAAAPPPLAPPQPVRRRLVEPAVAPPPRPRATLVPAMGDMLSNEAAAAFPTLDLSLGDPSPSGAPAAARRRARSIAGGAVGSRNWGANAIVAAEILGTPVGLRAGATVGVPHAF